MGFCFNSVWRAIKKQSLYLWGNGFVDFRDVDRAWRIFTGMKMGPFGLMDAVGLDTVYNIEMVYFNDSKDQKDKPPEACWKKLKEVNWVSRLERDFTPIPIRSFSNPIF